MTQTFIPFSNYVLVRPIEIPDTTPSGLVLPESSKEKPNQGEIVAVGNGQLSDRLKRIPVSAKVGDKVIFPKYSGNELKLNGEKFILMRDTDIFGVIEETK
jgi:chaperonin GroES